MIGVEDVTKVHQRLAAKLINAVSASAWLPLPLRVGPWRLAGVEVGKDVVDVRSGCWMNTARLSVGDRVFINAGLTVDGFERVTIGDGCWLGAGVTVLPGVNIGSGCVIGAASVVTKDLEPNGLYVGSPARPVRPLAC